MAKRSKWEMRNKRTTENAALRNIVREARDLRVSEAAVIRAHKFLNDANVPTTRAAVIQLAIVYNDEPVIC